MKRPPKEMVDNFRAMRVKVIHSNVVAMEMFSHPEATPEHLASTREIAVRIKAHYLDVRENLRTIWPRGGIACYPWNDIREDKL